jgi:murein DD-endopeptidase MepM/ murein hydrolase activator NlpD
MINLRVKLWPSAGIFCLVVILLSACAPAHQTITPNLTLPPGPAASPNPSLTPAASPTARPTPTTAAPQPTARPIPELCSPLEGKPLGDLEGLIVNPYLPPPPGSDDPHQGADYAILDPAFQYAVSGWPVTAALDGQVAAVILNRFPYGNAVLIETPLDSLPDLWRERMALPTPAAPLGPHPALTCPPAELPLGWPQAARSLYVLYAHLEEAPFVDIGADIACGQTLGAVGSSGNALNPHLHLEVRVGPSGARFSSLAHYLPSASEEEMGNYCLWRVSGHYQVIDPQTLLMLPPAP